MKRLVDRVTRNPILLLLVFIAVALVAHAHPLHASAVVGAGGALKAMIMIDWRPAMSRADLDLIANPMSAQQPEVIPWQLYDTQAVTTAVNAPAVFYQTINADKTMSNMEGPGQLPDPQYFVVQYVACDFLQVPTATVLTGEPNAAVANVENLLKTCRATFEFNMSNKRYGPFSLSMTAATGGATGSGYAYGTAANGTSMMIANNGIPGSGGFPFSGALVIPPKIGFDVTVRFGVAPTIVGGPLNVRISLVGQLYRRVL